MLNTYEHAALRTYAAFLMSVYYRRQNIILESIILI